MKSVWREERMDGGMVDDWKETCGGIRYRFGWTVKHRWTVGGWVER